MKRRSPRFHGINWYVTNAIRFPSGADVVVRVENAQSSGLVLRRDRRRPAEE